MGARSAEGQQQSSLGGLRGASPRWRVGGGRGADGGVLRMTVGRTLHQVSRGSPRPAPCMAVSARPQPGLAAARLLRPQADIHAV